MCADADSAILTSYLNALLYRILSLQDQPAAGQFFFYYQCGIAKQINKSEKDFGLLRQFFKPCGVGISDHHFLKYPDSLSPAL